MNPNLVQALQQEFQLSAKDIADIFWLASHIDQYSESVTPANEPSPSPSAEPSSDSSSSSQTPPESPPQPVSQADNPKNPPENSPEDKSASSVSPQPPQSEIVPKPEPSQTAPGGGGLPIRLSDAPSLRGPLTLARALKPLMRRVSGGRDWVIDEVATSEQIASQGIWIPVLRPRLEPWLDLDLVIEDCVSMLLWRHTLRDLEKLLKNYGIFRDVRVWSLLTDNPEAVKIRRGIGATAKHQAPRSPRELIDPTGRRLVIVVSDCVSKVWREGKMIPILDLWAKRGSMAILQMLPEWMWKRSGLGWEALVRLQGLNPGDWNQNLKVDEFPLWWDEEVTHQVVKVPIFTLEPESVGSWARLVAGKGNVWAAGYLFKYAEHQRRRQRPNSGGELTAEKRVNGFRATASRVARKLAGLLAAAPVITLPVVRLIQATLLKESLPVNVAEVFLGGLLKPISEIDMETDPELVQYDFMPGVRELLLESVPVDETVRVIDEVSGYVARNLGFAVEDFGAILKNPRQLGEGEVQGNAIAFARVTAQILRSLGGVYVEYAEQLESPSVVEAQQTQTEEPERLFQQSLELRTELGDRLGMGISYNSLAFVHRQLNKIPEAIAAWRAGLAICSPDRFPLEALELGRNLGNIAFDLQNWETTIEGYNQAILAIEQSRYWATSEATKRELVANSLDIYENMVQACINNQDYPQALLTVERSKSRTLLELLDSANLYPKNATNAQKQRISDLRRQIGSYQQQLAYTPTTENNLNQPSPETLIRQQLQSANEQLQDLLTELDDPNFTLTAQVPAQLPDLRRLLPPQTALIEWYLPSEAESGFYAFLVTRRRDQQIQITPHHFSAEDRQHLDQALKDYRSDYGKPSWNQQLPQRLETLSAALQLPRLLAELSEIQHLILIPHRELHLIPLHALPVSLPSPSGSETKPLQDWFPVQYAPSCQILNYLQNLPPVNREIAPFFAIQNPTEDLDYENLGVELLCRKFSPHQVLRHDQARLANLTEPDTQTFLEQSHAVHFACHGEFDVCNPLNAYLRLANGEKLTFVDIVTSLSLPVCRLLVLCSSQTGLVETSLTDDYLGLSSAFLLTGARTVVASLWNVDELAATLVTLRLYQILPDYPSVTAALQAAQTWLRGLSCDDVLDWLKHEFKATEEELEEVEDRLSLFDDPPFESPHYWAAFVAIAGPSG
ncbi:SAV_2336 N-terminal domain-related protein [Limnospira platensis]|uniref:SAV_2336 N-terminal domain-related protein n=1 Tax=Limnospira platensis TaxID=118562 RepID=UPI0033961E81